MIKLRNILFTVMATCATAMSSATGFTTAPDTIYVAEVIIETGAADQDIKKQSGNFITRRFVNNEKIPVDTTVIPLELLDEKVIVGNDTISIIIPQNNYGRYDRGLYNFLFIPRGEWSFGLTASYGEFSSKDIQMLSVIKDLDLGIKAYSLKPNIAYSIRNNQTVGLKFNYTRMTGNLGSFSLDIDEDLSFTIGDITYYSQSYSAGIFYRNYVGLGRQKRFGVFNEIDLSFGSGSSRFKRLYNSKMRDTRTNITQAGLNFSPGVCVFIMDNVSCNVSFGVFGLHLRKENQLTDGVEEGSRFTSGANFKFNIFNINFGMAVHI